MNRFVHLHVHSHYSLLDGLGKIPELVARAKELGMDALALTDHGAMYGAIEFYEECKKQGVKPIIGMETYVAPHKLTDKRPKIDDANYHLVLLATNREGYENLMRLTTVAHLEGYYYRPRVDKELLRRHAGGLIALSGCLSGEIPTALKTNNTEKARVLLAEYQSIFGKENFFIELQHHPDIPDQITMNEKLVALAREREAPMVVTKDPHYIHPDERDAQDVLLAIQTGKTVDDPTRLTMRDFDASLSAPEEIVAAFAHLPEAVENTARIAERVSLALDLGAWNFPPVEIPNGRTADELLREAAEAGVKERIGDVTADATERLNYELSVIAKRGFAPYFLTVAEYVGWARAQGIVVTTRGSAAGSLVAYALKITTANPLFFKLPFERFINLERPTPPDMDVDFADDRRDEVIEYVTQKYGRDRVAQICTFGTMMARGAVRDVARALGYPYGVGDRISKMIPIGSQGFPMTIAKACEQNPELAAHRAADPDARRILALAEKIEGCVRHVSVHAAGVVIAPRPLVAFTPLQREAGEGMALITQYDMHAVESAGLLKMDFLGIRNLSILGNAVKIVGERHGIAIDLDRLPLDDAKTFALLGKGDTTGLFQLGGSGMTRYLRELQPSTIFDIMAMVALYRPGPIESIPEFIRRKHNPRLIKLLDPRMKDILSQSYGVITYQDDVLLTAIELAGYSWTEADKLRKAIGKKIPKEMAAQKEKLLAGLAAHGMSQGKAHELWALIEPFAAYGFNKAHAAAYAMVAYQTAYLKANYPVEFMNAVLTAESGNLEKIATVVAECRDMGIEILPPDVNESERGFAVKGERRIRFGLLTVKNLGSDVIEGIIAERARGPFKDIWDFVTRIPVRSFNKKSLEALIQSGALDAFGERNQLLVNVEHLLAAHREAEERVKSGQTDLFGNANLSVARRLKDAEPATRADQLAWEKELLGLYLTDHPFASIARALGSRVTALGALGEAGRKETLICGGVVATVKKTITKNGESMIFTNIEDERATIEGIVFPRVAAESGAAFNPGACVLIRGRRSEKDEEARLIVERAVAVTEGTVEQMFASLSGGTAPPVLTIRFDGQLGPEKASELKTLLVSAPGGRRVVLRFGSGSAERAIETPFAVNLTSELKRRIEESVGGMIQ